MPVLDTTEFNFSAEHALGADKVARRVAVVKNDSGRAVLHVGVMPSKLFFDKRVVHDIAGAYYGHPTAWNEIGFGGPASPRGYVRLDANRRDPWEAAEGKPGEETKALKENQHVV